MPHTSYRGANSKRQQQRQRWQPAEPRPRKGGQAAAPQPSGTAPHAPQRCKPAQPSALVVGVFGHRHHAALEGKSRHHLCGRDPTPAPPLDASVRGCWLCQHHKFRPWHSQKPAPALPYLPNCKLTCCSAEQPAVAAEQQGTASLPARPPARADSLLDACPSARFSTHFQFLACTSRKRGNQDHKGPNIRGAAPSEPLEQLAKQNNVAEKPHWRL